MQPIFHQPGDFDCERMMLTLRTMDSPSIRSYYEEDLYHKIMKAKSEKCSRAAYG